MLVAVDELLTRDGGAHQGGDFMVGRPDVLQVHRLAILGGAQRRGGDVLTHGAQQGIRHDQRRAGQVVGAHVRRNAAFEVTVARQDRHRNQLVAFDRIDDMIFQRAGVADTGRAAIAHGVEAHRVQFGLQARAVEVVGHNLRSRCERGLHPRLGLQAQRTCLFRHQACRDQHGGVGGVGARGDGRDHHVAVTDLVIGASHLGLLVLVGFGHAQAAGQFLLERLVRTLQHDAVLRALGAGDGRHDGLKVEFQRIGEHGVRRFGMTEHALCLQVFRRQLDAVFLTAGLAQVIQRQVINREEAAGRAIFRGHVGDGRTVGNRQVVKGGAEEFDKLADNALLAQHLRDRQHEVGGGRPLGQLANQLEADHIGDEHGDRLAQHRGFRLDPANAPAQNAHAVDHGGVAVRAEQGVGIGVVLAIHIRRPHRLRDVFQVHLVADSGARRHDGEVFKRFLAPAQEGVAFAIALELDGHVVLQRFGRTGHVHHDRMVDHQVDGNQRVHLLRVALQLQDAVAHRGQIDHGGNAGEILHQDTRGLEGNFLRAAPFLQPFRNGLGILNRIGMPVLAPQHVFQQHFQADRQAADGTDRLFSFRD